MPDTAVPAGTYAGGARSPVAWVYLCPSCGGYKPMTSEDYSGFLSGACTGCGSACRELHKFPAVIDSAAGCGCRGMHERVTGDLAAASPERVLREFRAADPVERVVAAGHDFMAAIEAEDISSSARARISFAAGAFAGEALKAVSTAYREMAGPLDALTALASAHIEGQDGADGDRS